MSRSQAFDGAQDTARAIWLRLRRALSTGRPAAMLTPSNLFRAARHLVAPKTVSTDDKATDRPLRPTAYLDGLRGFAAFLVYWHHHELWAHMYPPGRTEDIFENSWGRNGEYHLATFYGTRLFFTGGHIAVAIFYVISGYVLTLKALQCIQNGQHARVADVVASALFRRWFRLYIPVLVTTFVLITVWHLFGIWNPQTEPKPTYVAEVLNWYSEFKNLSFIFKEGPMWPSYNGHLWSIPLEMRGSIITYVAALTLFRATTKARLLCEIGLVFYFMYICDAWYGSVFMTGMLQCDLDLLARRSEPNSGFPSFLRRLEPHKKAIYYALLVLALFCSGVPSHSRDVDEFRSNPGWYYLFSLKPAAVFDAKWFFLAIAANCLVAAIPRIPWLKRFFEGRFCQYLGRISFSLYLVHGPILHLLGDRLYHAVGFVAPFQARQEKYGRLINSFPLPIAGPLGLEPAFLLPHVILLPVTLWISDIVTRHVDEPAVKFSQWMWNSIQQPKEQTSLSPSSFAAPPTVTRLENGHAAAALRRD